MSITDKQADAIADAVILAMKPQVPDIRKVVREAIAKAAEPDLPPKPEKLPDGFALTGECRLPKKGESYWETGYDEPGNFHDLPAGRDHVRTTCRYGGNRWILSRRPDEAPDGYTWSARGYDVPNKGEWYVPGDRTGVPLQSIGIHKPHEKRWLLTPIPAPKSAFMQYYDEQRYGLDSFGPSTASRHARTWNAALAAVEYRGHDCGSTLVIGIADSLKEKVQ